MKLLVLLCVVAVAYGEEEKRFDGYKVFRIHSVTTRQTNALKKFLESPEIDIWSTNPSIDFMVRPDRVKSTMAALTLMGIKPEIWIEDVQKRIDGENPLKSTRMDWTSYHDYDEIMSWLSDFQSTHSSITTLSSVGKSYENRDMNVLIINKNPAVEKPVVWIDSNIHAREWITSATVTWMMNEMLTSTDPEVMQLLDDWEFHIMPVMNPDGFQYSHTNNRLWRKTRTPGSFCYGADPNRNWGFHWDEGGSSDSECSDTYHGSAAFSEPSAKVSSDYISTLSGRMKLSLSYHSYSQLYLTPWGYTYTHPSDYNELKSLGDIAAAALREVHGTVFTVGTVPDQLYIASGGSTDWAKGVGGSKYAYTLELRDRGQYGFILPANQIIPSGEENLAGLIAMLAELKNRLPLE